MHLSCTHISCLNSQIDTVYTWVTRSVSYKKQELLTLHEHLSSPSVFFGGVLVAHLFLLFCVVLLCVFTL
jgi:hypothetical protein